MERQKEAFEARYATKMGKILTKLSKETNKARVQAASTKTSPFKVSKEAAWSPIPVSLFHILTGVCESFCYPEILQTTPFFVQHPASLTRVVKV